jgi:hypothetical protein
MEFYDILNAYLGVYTIVATAWTPQSTQSEREDIIDNTDSERGHHKQYRLGAKTSQTIHTRRPDNTNNIDLERRHHKQCL